MALFPRRIGGKYVMLSRRDRENLHLATSTDVGHWADVSRATPAEPVPGSCLQIGNCGSPIETAAGWLVITHGVGPMRRYAHGRAAARSRRSPTRDRPAPRAAARARGREREGYVPNVVYSCGAMVNGNDLVLPYGLSDAAVGIAIIALPELLAELQRRD